MTEHDYLPDGEFDRIPIADPEIGSNARERVLQVLDSGDLADGDVVRQFESAFADYVGTEYAVATSNGTTALHTALVAADVGAGDTVVTSPFSFVASANTVRLANAEPVFADVDPDTFNLDPDAVEAVLRERRRDDRTDDVAAIMPVHLFGLPADVERFRELGEEYDVAVIEDAAQAHGAAIDGQSVGTFGDAGCFSFYPTKNMTTGEGGIVTTDDPEIAVRAKRFVNHGRETDGYAHVEVGHNFRMTNIAGAIGVEQLRELPGFVSARRERASVLDDAVADTPATAPTVPDGYHHAYNQYTIRCTGTHLDRDAVRDRLDERGIGSAVYYPTPIPDLEAYDGYSATVPNARHAAEEVLSLPVHPNVSNEGIHHVADAVRDVLGEQEVRHG